MSALHPSILRAYDIRGVAGETLMPEDGDTVARAFVACASKKLGAPIKTMCVLRDGRLSSPALSESLKRGLVASGVEVFDGGIGPTPMLYHATITRGVDAGIMLTGSHNPPAHNGFKFILKSGGLFYGDDIKMLGRTAEAEDYIAGTGSVRASDFKTEYVKSLADAYGSTRKLNVAWDAGNGATGEVLQSLAQILPGKHTLLNEAIDGHFPAHHPDPSVPENLQQLIETVRANGCDVGIAFDGDGDRIGAVDNQGGILWGDELMMVLAQAVLEERKGATIIADVKASQVLFDHIADKGGIPLMWKTGHSHIKAKLKETGAALAGEMSGHVFFADKYYGFDDGLYAGIRLLDILAKSGRTLAEMRQRFPKTYSTPEIRFACDDARKFTLVEEIKSTLVARGEQVSDIDGIRVNTRGGWWGLRASNTQAMLTARLEATSEAALASLINDLKGLLAERGVMLPDC